VRLGLLSDIHGNRVALAACIDELEAAEVDDIHCLGDIVGYGPDPAGCIDLLRTKDIPSVLGNHDIAIADGEGLEWFNPLAREAALWTREQLSEEHLAYLANLPRTRTLGTVTLCHGAPNDTHHYVISSEEGDEALATVSSTYVACGHTHLPTVHVIGDRPFHMTDFEETTSVRIPPKCRALVNPGSVGQPRDGFPAAACAILDTRRRTFSVHRVEYDVDAVMGQMMELSLPEMLASRLAVGH
jgi:predicted phosphodiesterase